jgi:hypothetical protein
MNLNKKYASLLCAFYALFHLALSQEKEKPPLDTLNAYHIITLKDGSILKGKITSREKQSIRFQDELIGSISFRTKEISSIELVNPQEYYLITMVNGTTLQGKIANKNNNELSIQTANIGVVNIEISRIKTIQCITPGNMKDGKYWFKTHIDAHYLISPSAIPLSPGEAYFQNTMALYNSFNVGITNNISFLGGVILPIAAFFSPNINFKITNGVYAGCGIIAADITGLPYGGAAYGQLTFGGRNAHVSLAGGYGVLEGIEKYYITNKITKIEIGLISINATKRFSPKYAIVTENWFTPTEGISIITGGLRLMGEKNSWDFGIARISSSSRISGNPILFGPISYLSYMRNL